MPVREQVARRSRSRSRLLRRTTPAATFWLGGPPQPPLDAYWRVDVPARHMPAQVRILDQRFRDQEGGAAIFVMPHSSRELAAIEEAKQRGIRVLVEVDDCLLDISPRLLALTHLKVPIGDTPTIDVTPQDVENLTGVWRERQRLHRQAAETADAVIVSTSALADSYRCFSRAVFICPNQIDPADWPDNIRTRNVGVFTVG